MVVSGYAVCQVNSCSPLVQQVIHRLVVAVLCFGGGSMGGSGTRSCGRTDHESCELSEHHCGSVAPLHGVCLPNWKWNVPAGQRSVSQVLEWFEEHTDEFHLMSWPPNLPDLNPMEHIWDVMERQLRAQTSPCPNILQLCATAA
ncbi:hypothetical protein AVEN_161457-1 [Araneus ventricosus]|uniref:Tc1-like transposase DDE domain-containing protein n=1 Tax=Araneus ventricosus TaxID=182803 RepID=A0A4Y2IH64_ARAVE|nr:hypothetical protein AVEN_161457-1 [Araneus ventricosus]